MVELHAHFDGRVIVPDEPLALEPNQRLRIRVELMDASAPANPGRRLGLQRGAVLYVAADFDAELADGFWLADDQ